MLDTQRLSLILYLIKQGFQGLNGGGKGCAQLIQDILAQAQGAGNLDGDLRVIVYLLGVIALGQGVDMPILLLVVENFQRIQAIPEFGAMLGGQHIQGLAVGAVGKPLDIRLAADIDKVGDAPGSLQ